MKKRILSGIRPTGKLHLGHWVGVLSNWVKLQQDYECFFMVADWHALMSEYKNSGLIKDNIIDNVADWLAWGIDPEKSVIFVQSEVSEHAELFMFFSMIVPLGMLYRCPTFKEQMVALKEKDVNTYAFLGYPALQAADILLYNSHSVPVGEDQLPHLELTREIARKFHHIYNCDIFNEPKSILTPVPKLLGSDGRKMSKSYNNCIDLDEDKKTLEKKILSMVTDTARVKKDDPGHPDVCNVFSYHKCFNSDSEVEIRDWCENAKKGCVDCKKVLLGSLVDIFESKQKKKKEILKDKSYILSILKEGKAKAGVVASDTLVRVRKAVFK